jgi:hypothetical protein
MSDGTWLMPQTSIPAPANRKMHPALWASARARSTVIGLWRLPLRGIRGAPNPSPHGCRVGKPSSALGESLSMSSELPGLSGPFG